MLLILVAVLLPLLASCGFGGGDALEIEDISCVLLPDGRTEIMFTYYNADPQVWYIDAGKRGPQGMQGVPGEDGPAGNGISGITITNEENGEQTMTITYTDKKLQPVKVTVKDGVSIVSCETNLELDPPQLNIHFSDGSTTQVPLPKGADGAQGVGITGYSTDWDADGNTLVWFDLSDGTSMGPITLYRGEVGKDGVGFTGEVKTEEATDAEGNQGVNVQFYLTNGTLAASIFMRHGQDGAGVKEVVSEDLLDENGQVIGKQFYFQMTDDTTSDIFEVYDGISVVDIKRTTITPTGETEVTVFLSDGTSKKFLIPAAISIKDMNAVVNQDGSTTVTITTTNPDADPLSITLPKGVGIKEITIDDSDDGTNYIMNIVYDDDTTQTVVFGKPNAWHNGNTPPDLSVGKWGDYYLDTLNNKIYFKDKELGKWEIIVDFSIFQNPARVTFKIDSTAGETWDYRYSTRNVDLQMGQSFHTAGEKIIVPQREGYKFVGWYTTKTPDFAIDGAFNSLTMVSGDITLYPVWEPIA